jgi:hypothetical protein
MQLPNIGVFWKHDLPDGFGFIMQGAHAEHIRQHIEKFLPAAIADLRANPEAKNHLLDQLAWFATNRTQLSDEEQSIYGGLMAVNIAALGKTGFIVSDEFNGIVYAAAAASVPLGRWNENP